HHSGREACPEQRVQRSVEVVMRLRLSDNTDTLLRGQAPVLPDPYAERHDPVTLVIVALNQEGSPSHYIARARSQEPPTCPPISRFPHRRPPRVQVRSFS